MKRVMISQPMANKSEQEIADTRYKATMYLESKGYEVENTLFANDWKDNETAKGITPLRFLAKSINAMSFCDAVYFCRGWENARGCRIEHDAAWNYGLEIIYE